MGRRYLLLRHVQLQSNLIFPARRGTLVRDERVVEALRVRGDDLAAVFLVSFIIITKTANRETQPLIDEASDPLRRRHRIREAVGLGTQRVPHNTLDVAAAVLFLTLPESRYITGETINVNGGMAMI